MKKIRSYIVTAAISPGGKRICLSNRMKKKEAELAKIRIERFYFDIQIEECVPEIV